MPSRGSYRLTIAQAAVELKISTADVRRLIRSGKLPALEVEAVGVRRVSRDAVEHLKEEIAAGRLRVPTRWGG